MYELTKQAAEQMAEIVNPEAIGIGVMVGTRATDSAAGLVAYVVALENRNAYAERGKSLQDSWSYNPDDLAMVEEIAAKIGADGTILGLVHTHRHAKTMPSVLDWRRQRYSHAFGAVFHPGSGLLTLTDRGRPGKPGRIVSRQSLIYPADTVRDWRRYCAEAKDLDHPKLAGVEVVTGICV